MAKVIFEYTSQMLLTCTYNSLISFLLTDRLKKPAALKVSSVQGRGKKNAHGILISLHYIQSKYE